jgi:large subunit ribosomal protein L15
MKSKTPHHKRPKRIGRGPGSGHGKTSTKGHKGQRARSGFSQRPDFEGGQNPYYRRVPKRGFHHARRQSFAIVNLDQLGRLDGVEITMDNLRERGVIRKNCDALKVLGRGKIDKPLTVRADRFSAQAKKAIEAAGGKALLASSSDTQSSVGSAKTS